MSRKIATLQHSLFSPTFFVVATVLAAGLSVALAPTVAHKMSLFFATLSTGVSLYALYRVSTRGGALSVGLSLEADRDAASDSRSVKLFLYNDSSSAVHCEVRTVTTSTHTVRIDSSQFPLSLVVPPKSVAELPLPVRASSGPSAQFAKVVLEVARPDGESKTYSTELEV